MGTRPVWSNSSRSARGPKQDPDSKINKISKKEKKEQRKRNKAGFPRLGSEHRKERTKVRALSVPTVDGQQ